MMALVCFKNTLGKQSEFKEIDKETLISAITEYARINHEFNELIFKQKVVLYLNNESVKVDDWQLTELTDTDEIIISPAIKGGDNAGWASIAIGVLLVVVGIVMMYTPAAAFGPGVIMAGAGMILGGASALLFQPDLPKLPSRSSSSQTYNWNGISTAARADIPVPVVYGSHRVGGNIISIFTQMRGYDEYLYVMLGLCEGEIDGIYKYDSSDVMTEYYCNDTSAFSPDIELDGQPISYYNDWEMWWRPGLNQQDQIPNFDGSKLLYQSGNEVTEFGLTYQTQGDVDYITATLSAPALYTVSGGEILPYTIKYQVEYKLAAEPIGDYVILDIDKYTPYVESASGGAQEGQATVDSYRYGQSYYYATSTPHSVVIEVISNSYRGMAGSYNYTIVVDVYNEDTTLLEAGVSITQTVRQVATPNPEFSNYGGGKAAWEAGIPRYLYTPTDIQVAFVAGVYTIKIAGTAPVGGVFTISSTEETNDTNMIIMTDKSKTGLTSTIDINFRELGLGKDIYDVKFTRTDGGVSDDFSTENTLNLDSVLEVLQGMYSYPHTALVALKLKATGQLSGQVPSVTTKIKGKLIDVPNLSGAAEFDDHFWAVGDDTWKTVTASVPQTWDGTSWTEEHSHNAMLCTRDMVLNDRYGLGKYMTATDLSTIGVTDAIKECHTWFPDVPSHYHPYDGVLESEQAALTLVNEMCNAYRCWPIWTEGALDFVLDKDTTPVHSIAMSNTINFSQAFVPLSEIPYKAYGQFTSAENDYDMRSILALSGDQNLLKLNESTIGLKGITNFDRAARELKFRLNKAINCTHTVNFKCGLDKIHASAGDLIYVQNDLPQWGQGGRIVSYNKATLTIVVDAAVAITSTAAPHTIRFQDENGELQTTTLDLSGKSDNTSYLSFPLDSHVATPAGDAVFTVGRSTGEPKLFRLMSVSRSLEDEVDVTAIEHFPALYDDPDVAIVDDNYSELPNPHAIPGLPRLLVIDSYEGGLGFYIKAIPPPNAEGVIAIAVQISTDGISFTDIGQLTPSDWSLLYTSPSLETDRVYYFKLFCKTATKQGGYIIVESTLYATEYVLQPASGMHIKGQSPNVQTFDGKNVTIAWNPVGLTAEQSASVKGYLIDIYHLSSLDDLPSISNFMNQYSIKSEEFEYTFEENERNAGHTGAGHPIIAFILYTEMENGGISSGSFPFVVRNTVPNPVQGLSARPFSGQVQFWWTRVSIPDFAAYEYRYKIESFGTFTEWEAVLSNTLTIGLTATDKENNYDDIYIDVRVVDAFDQTSTENSLVQTADSLYVNVTDVDGFEESISGEFFYIPILDADGWTNHSPTSSAVAWNAHTVWLDTNQYSIAAGNTTDKYIYWEDFNGYYTTSDTHPGSDLVTDQDFIIGTNIGGVYKRAWGAIANQAIGSAYIQNAAIGDAHINTLSANVLTAGTIMTPGIYIGDCLTTGGLTIDNISGEATSSTEGADWDTNLQSIPNRFEDPDTVPGLYVTSTFMGYFNGTSFKSYIDAQGDFFFGTGTGSTDKFLFWDASAGQLTLQTDESGGLRILNTGSMIIDGGGSLVVSDGGDLTINDGGDIHLYSTVSDYSAITFWDKDSNIALRIWSPLTSRTVTIGTPDDAVTWLYLGDPSGRLKGLLVYADNMISLRVNTGSIASWIEIQDAIAITYSWETSSTYTTFSLCYDGAYNGGYSGVATARLRTVNSGAAKDFYWDSYGYYPGQDGTIQLGKSGNRWKDVWAVDTTINSSDERQKVNIDKVPLGLDFVNSVDPISFRWKDKGKRIHYGFSAQKVEIALDNIGIPLTRFAGVIYDKETDVYGLRVGEFTPILWTATQELHAEIEILKARIDELEAV